MMTIMTMMKMKAFETEIWVLPWMEIRVRVWRNGVFAL